MLRQFEHSFRGVFIGHQQGGSERVNDFDTAGFGI
jgi:hypothetical protein